MACPAESCNSRAIRVRGDPGRARRPLHLQARGGELVAAGCASITSEGIDAAPRVSDDRQVTKHLEGAKFHDRPA